MVASFTVLAEAEEHRNPSPSLGSLRLGPTFLAPGLLLDDERRSVWRDGTELPLTPTEHGILGVLTEESGRIVADQVLIDRVWGRGAAVAPQTLYVHASALRRKLGPKAPLRRRYGAGYLLDLPRR